MKSLLLVAALLGLFIAAESKALSSICPNGENLVYCFVDPCQVSRCHSQPTASCKSNYCGGCNANWFLPNGMEVKSADCGTTSA